MSSICQMKLLQDGQWPWNIRDYALVIFLGVPLLFFIFGGGLFLGGGGDSPFCQCHMHINYRNDFDKLIVLTKHF